MPDIWKWLMCLSAWPLFIQFKCMGEYTCLLDETTVKKLKSKYSTEQIFEDRDFEIFNIAKMGVNDEVSNLVNV